jgi:hypothetical protein
MKLHPFYECAEAAQMHMEAGARVFQQFNCSHCGAKQTMDDPNVFYKLGTCEECKQVTDIEKEGCNYMLHAIL